MGYYSNNNRGYVNDQELRYVSDANWDYARAPRAANRYGVTEPPKHTGCKAIDVNGSIIVYGWNYSRRNGMVHFYARPYKGTKERTSKSGKVWLNYFVTMTNVSTKQKTNTSGLLDLSTKRVYIKEFNILMNPSSRRGGYCGKHISKR